MGILIAKRYRTKIMAYLADHTYVECSAGKGWSCWGGKSDGQSLTSGSGSTKRANMIADLDEKAGITRYLIDGVCHQAANRILVPAGILVSDARGYRLSQSIFGTYGRSSFNMHSNVTGDLGECKAKALASPTAESASGSRDNKLVRSNKAHVARQHKISHLDSLNLNVRRFMLDVNILLPNKLSRSSLSGLKNAKSDMELRLQEMDAAMTAGYTEPSEFVRKFDQNTDRFQEDVANALNQREYKELFLVDRDERIRLTDPKAVDQAFGPGTFEKAQSAPPM